MENKIRELWNSGEHYEKFHETGEECKPKFLELFAGSCHMAKAFKEAGIKKTIGGTQGKADNYERSLYPKELIDDIVNCYAVKT
jgi:hypothetical protein